MMVRKVSQYFDLKSVPPVCTRTLNPSLISFSTAEGINETRDSRSALSFITPMVSSPYGIEVPSKAFGDVARKEVSMDV